MEWKHFHIQACLFASVNYKTGETSYGVCTLDPNPTKSELNRNKIAKPMELGIWDGVRASGVGWAEDPRSTIAELVTAIAEGIKEYDIRDFSFTFEYPDYMTVCFTEKKDGSNKYSAIEDILIRERPLNEHEREQFAKAIAAL